MKNVILSILTLLLSGIASAQQRDLEYYLDQAKINSPLINKYRNENKLVQFDLQQVKSILSKPEINLEANVLFAPIISRDNNSSRFKWISNGTDKYSGYDLASTDGGQYQALVTVNQPIFTKNKFKSYSDRADVSQQINENTIALTEHEIEQLVCNQYILCLKSKIETDNNTLILKVVQEQLTTLQKLVENAIYKQTDLMLLQIEYQTYMSQKEALISEYRNNLYDLNLLCGIRDTSLAELKDVNIELKSETLTGSQFSKSYKLDSLSIVAEQKISDLKYKPEFNIFANAGLNAVYLPSFNRLGFSTGISVKWNIFDGNQRKIQMQKSSVNISTIEFDKNNFIIQKETYKNKIYRQISSLNHRIALSDNQLDQYDKLLLIYNKELSGGEISVMDYKNLLKDITSKKEESLLLKMEKQLLIISYNYWNY